MVDLMVGMFVTSKFMKREHGWLTGKHSITLSKPWKIAVMSANDRLRVYRQLSSLDHINPTMSLEAAAGSNCVLLQLTVDW